MMKILLPLLAAITLVAVGFVLVELHTPITPESTAPPPPVFAPPPPLAAPPVAAPPIAAPSRPPAEPADPLDVVVRGKTRREWHAIYTDRQLQIANEMRRSQAIIDRAIAQEEPDPTELANAHTRVAELKAQLKTDLEELRQIDGLP